MFDTATASHKGKRADQEDSLVCDFAHGALLNFTVLADGMGGHAAGDVASEIATSLAFKELRKVIDSRSGSVGGTLRGILKSANDAIKQHAASHPATQGMGTTFVAVAIQDNLLHWISVGDSPLYLFRNGALQQLNQDHSLAPQIDLLVTSGLMSPEDGRDHPDRSVLTSVLIGGDIPKVDCPATPIKLRQNDVLIVASDGLQSLDHAHIESVLVNCANQPSYEIAASLMHDVQTLDFPDQDNVTFSVVRVLAEQRLRLPAIAPQIHVKEAAPKIISFFRNHFHSAPATRTGSPGLSD